MKTKDYDKLLYFNDLYFILFFYCRIGLHTVYLSNVYKYSDK